MTDNELKAEIEQMLVIYNDPSHQHLLGVLERALAQLQGQWVSVEDRLPEASSNPTRSKSVLVYCPSNLCSYTATYDLEKQIWSHFGGGGYTINYEVTHWQALPSTEELGDE